MVTAMAESNLVSLELESCIQKLHDAVTGAGGALLDRYELSHPKGGRCVVLVYEKHCWRPGSPFSLSLTSVADRRITLTVTADDYEGAGLTRLHCVSGGGGRGLLDADRGEAGEFENAVLRALDDIRD